VLRGVSRHRDPSVFDRLDERPVVTLVLVTVARSLAPKRDGLIGATLVRVVVVAHKIFAALREREVKRAAQGQGELYARVWCDLRTHLKFSSCVIKLHCPVFLNAEHTGTARTVIGPPVTNQLGVHLLCTRTPHKAND